MALEVWRCKGVTFGLELRRFESNGPISSVPNLADSSWKFRRSAAFRNEDGGAVKRLFGEPLLCHRRGLYESALFGLSYCV